MPFPAELSNAIDGVTEIVAAHLNNLEAKVGIDNSAVATTLDYLLKNAGSIDPGHKHTAEALSGGNNGEVLYKAAGVWGPGTPEAAGLVAKSGDQEIAGVKTFTSIPVGPGSNPTTDNQLARKAYVDLMLPLAGGTMAGNIAMNNQKVTGLAAASGAGEALRYDEWTGGQDPGHKHSKLWASDGSPEAVTVDAGGNVGIGTTSPEGLLDVMGGPLILTNSNVNHGRTLYGPTNQYGRINISHATDGGLTIHGFSDAANRSGLYLRGTIGVTDPTNTIAAIMFEASKANGETGIVPLDSSETVFQLWNYGTAYMTVQGNGNIGIGTASPGKKLDVSGYLRGVGIFNTLNTAPADGDLAAGECAWWFDKTDGAAKFMIKAKQNDGTVKTASISLS
ncbi:MAG: hypothetical protein PHU44_17795 [Syntrophales bacterium]|nr:hypothetical protein [Syntrophales bacterium]